MLLLVKAPGTQRVAFAGQTPGWKLSQGSGTVGWSTGDPRGRPRGSGKAKVSLHCPMLRGASESRSSWEAPMASQGDGEGGGGVQNEGALDPAQPGNVTFRHRAWATLGLI